MRILIRTSNWAIWARRLGSFALPLTLIPLLLHRLQLIGSTEFAIIEAIAAAVAVLAIVAAAGAFVRLWITGDRGWGRAVWGLVFGIVCLLPFGWLGYEASRYPLVYEVTTDVGVAMPLVSDVQVTPTAASLQAEIAAAFPNARTRTYPIEATQMFDIVLQQATQRGWEILADQAPADALGVGQINAIATNLFGWRDEVVLRVASTNQGSRIDMRSVPLARFSDFGDNGRRIEEFLVALDQQITIMLRDTPQNAVPAEPDAPAPAVTTDEDDEQ